MKPKKRLRITKAEIVKQREIILAEIAKKNGNGHKFVNGERIQ